MSAVTSNRSISISNWEWIKKKLKTNSYNIRSTQKRFEKYISLLLYSSHLFHWTFIRKLILFCHFGILKTISQIETKYACVLCLKKILKLRIKKGKELILRGNKRGIWIQRHGNKQLELQNNKVASNCSDGIWKNICKGLVVYILESLYVITNNIIWNIVFKLHLQNKKCQGKI